MIRRLHHQVHTSLTSPSGPTVTRGYHENHGARVAPSYRREILEAAERHGARNVRVFGSIARRDDHQESDVDFLLFSEV